jgi:hypothetical protein
LSFLEYRYPLLRPLLEVEGLRLAAPEDVAAMKTTIRGWVAAAARKR